MKLASAVSIMLSWLAVAAAVHAQTAQSKPSAPSASAPAVQNAPTAGAGARGAKASPVAPLAANAAAVSSHAPYEAGDCAICHQSANPKQPGPVTKKGTALCLECHEEFAGVMKKPHTHDPARSSCTSCHNPHNSGFRKLLLQEPRVMCTECHDEIGNTAAKSKVQHKAMNTGSQCTNCHNPHASAIPKLLVQQPFDLCVSCHSVDTMGDASGKKLQNIKAWLAKNEVWHGPVASKDCSACHVPHGSDHFRLLKEDYPREFYAPYDKRNYALCFSCHQEAAFSSAQTTTLTSFRNGATNLHYVHLQQPGRGRTCRACHEIHASKQTHHIRDGVPYGSGNWVLKLNYKKTATGGSCDKTCHQEKTYVNKTAAK